MKRSNKITQLRDATRCFDKNKNASSVASQLRYYRIAKNLTQGQLAKQIGVTTSAIGNWEAGRRRPDIDMMPKLCAVLGISVPSLYGTQPELTAEEENLILRFHSLTENNRAITSRMIDVMLDVQCKERQECVLANNRRIFWNDVKAAAGIGNPLNDGLNGRYVYLHKDDDVQRADEIITVTGDSMEPTYHDGDALLVEYAEELAPGEIGIFIADGDGYVKEYRQDGLYSHNSKYKPLHFSEDDNVRCVGRVLSVLRPDQFADPDEVNILEEARSKTR